MQKLDKFERKDNPPKLEVVKSLDQQAQEAVGMSFDAMAQYAAKLVERMKKGEKLSYEDMSAHEARLMRRLLKNEGAPITGDLANVVQMIENSERQYLNDLRDTAEGAKIVDLQTERTKIMKIPDREQKVIADDDWAERAKQSVFAPEKPVATTKTGLVSKIGKWFGLGK